MGTFRSFDGLELAYLDQGAGDPVVLLHGFAADHHANWVQPGVFQALLGAGWRVIAPDARGHGASGRPHDPEAYADDAAVRDVRALLDHLATGPVHLVGYSLGSVTALGVAAADQRVRSLVLCGLGAGMLQRMSEAGEPRRAAIVDALLAEDPAAIEHPVGKGFRAFADSTGADRLALAALQRARPLRVPDPATVTVPSLVIVGDADTLVGSAEELATALPRATCTVVTGDHLTAVADPTLTQAILGFLADHRAAGPPAHDRRG